MKKVKFLLVLLAMFSLTSCDFKEEPSIRYEVNSENPDECYVAEIVYGYVESEEENTDGIDLELERKVWNTDRRNVMLDLLLLSGKMDSNGVIYNISMPEENTSFVITYPEKKETISSDEYGQIFDEFVKNAEIITDTTYKQSYKLVISDSVKYSEAKFKDQTIDTECNKYQFEDNVGFCVKMKNYPYVSTIGQLICNLGTFYSIPVIYDKTDHEFLDTRILLKGFGFYSKEQSFGDVEKMLSKLGLSLEPTSEEMMVVTYSAEAVEFDKPYAFESEDYTMCFWMVVFISIIIGCIFVFLDKFDIYDFVPQSDNKRKRLKYSIPFWTIAMGCAIFFVMLVLNPEKYNFDVESGILKSIYFSIIFAACGIYVYRFRKSNSKNGERIGSFVLLLLMFIINGTNLSYDLKFVAWVGILLIMTMLIQLYSSYFRIKKKRRSDS